MQVRPVQSPGGWGYDITANGKVYIHQLFIPGLAGKHGFHSEADALKVGHRVIEKIKAHQVPTITTKDLTELGIIRDSLAAK